MIAKCARRLFQSYPSTDYEDKKAAVASYIEVLSGYSEVVVEFVTSNTTGIQRRVKFPPRIAELVEACDEAAAHIAKYARYQNWGKSQTAMLEGPPVHRPSEEEMLAKYGPNYGLNPNHGAEERKEAGMNFTAEQLANAAEQCKRLNETFEQPVTHRSFKEPAQPEKWVQQSHDWEKVIAAYKADPSRMQALYDTPHMNRKGKGPLPEPKPDPEPSE